MQLTPLIPPSLFILTLATAFALALPLHPSQNDITALAARETSSPPSSPPPKLPPALRIGAVLKHENDPVRERDGRKKVPDLYTCTLGSVDGSKCT